MGIWKAVSKAPLNLEVVTSVRDCQLQKYLVWLHFIDDVALFLFLIEGKILPQQNNYDPLYCDAGFIAMAWNQTCEISEVCLEAILGEG